jgi:hypothetical protein
MIAELWGEDGRHLLQPPPLASSAPPPSQLFAEEPLDEFRAMAPAAAA